MTVEFLKKIRNGHNLALMFGNTTGVSKIGWNILQTNRNYYYDVVCLSDQIKMVDLQTLREDIVDQQQVLSEMSNKVTQINSEIDNLDVEINQMNSNINQITLELETISKTINNMESTLTQLEEQGASTT